MEQRGWASHQVFAACAQGHKVECVYLNKAALGARKKAFKVSGGSAILPPEPKK